MKIILGIIIGISLVFPATLFAKGEWSDWWSLGGNVSSVKRIYDQENKLVCWVYKSVNSGGIDCEPSLELEHPLTR